MRHIGFTEKILRIRSSKDPTIASNLLSRLLDLAESADRVIRMPGWGIGQCLTEMHRELEALEKELDAYL